MMSSLPQGWEENKLSFLIDIIGGGTPKTSIEEYWNGNIPWLSVKDFNNDNRKVYKTEKTITELGLNKSSTRLLQKDELIISARGTVGELAQIPFPMAFNQSCYGLRGKKDKLNNTFLYYGLKNILGDIRNNTHGSVFSTITKQTFDTLSIKFPSDINEQKRIADILSAFDDKIELNNQMNQSLEDMATTLFKEWFENFNFPNEQGKPYKDNDGKMKSSELGEIPIDWEVKTLDTVVSMKYGKMPKKNDLVEKGYPIYSGYRVSGFHKEYLYENSELIIVARGVGGTGDVKFSPKKAWITNLSIVLPLCDERIKYYLFYVLTNKKLRYLDSGSAQSQITIGDLNILKLIFPNEDILTLFYIQINPIFEQIQQNQQQNQTLKQQRDTLLPKLMSGEIRV